MRATQLIISLILAASMYAISATAADTTSAANETSKLDSINPKSADMKDCPMHEGKKECDHKKGEPCVHHKNEKHQAKSHDKCDHKHPG